MKWIVEKNEQRATRRGLALVYRGEGRGVAVLFPLPGTQGTGLGEGVGAGTGARIMVPPLICGMILQPTGGTKLDADPIRRFHRFR